LFQPEPIAKDLAEQYQLDPRRTASFISIFSCGFQGLVPRGHLLRSRSNFGPYHLGRFFGPIACIRMLILLFGLAANCA